MTSIRLPQGLLLSLLLSCAVAFPASSEVGYLEYSAGASFVPNQNLTGSSPTSSGLAGSIRPEAGYVVGAAVGFNVFELGDAGLRAEIAIDYRQSDVDGMNAVGEATSAKGEIGLLTTMVNGYVDYDLDDLGVPIVPFLGIGIGYGRIEVDAQNTNSVLRINDQASVFAWNVMTGATIPYTKTIDFEVAYRYVATEDPELDARVSGIGPTRFDSEYDAHELTLGMRIKF
jgi:OOP family OmpA-OmpF porin